MARAFSVALWNAEHFRQSPRRIGEALDFVVATKPTVVALLEARGRDTFAFLTDNMPGYTFYVTEGGDFMEVLIGVKHRISAFVTQRGAFKSGVSRSRPGPLLTLSVDGTRYTLLFLQLKSLPSPTGFAFRDDMIQRALSFRRILMKAGASSKPNYLFLGDLHTCGMNLTHSGKNVSDHEEIARIRSAAKSHQMALLDKSADATFWPGSSSSFSPLDLDHVVASDHLKFKLFDGRPVDIRGWPNEPTANKKDAWVKRHSNRALIYFEVQKSSR